MKNFSTVLWQMNYSGIMSKESWFIVRTENMFNSIDFILIQSRSRSRSNVYPVSAAGFKRLCIDFSSS